MTVLGSDDDLASLLYSVVEAPETTMGRASGNSSWSLLFPLCFGVFALGWQLSQSLQYAPALAERT